MAATWMLLAPAPPGSESVGAGELNRWMVLGRCLAVAALVLRPARPG